MKISVRTIAPASLLLLLAAELVPISSGAIGIIGDARAIVGRPATPVSVAGVARRSAVREVAVVETAAVATTAAATSAAATSAAAASAASASAASAQAAAAQAAAAKPPAPAPAAGPLPVGTVVGALPAGCVSAPISGVEYYLCNGTYYRAAFQGNNLMYVVSKP
jgi:hypothetical protein